jgi:hypothetical protein
MSKFVLKNIEAIKGKQQFKQLVVLEDNADENKIQDQINDQEIRGIKSKLQGIFDQYENNLETKYTGAFSGIVAIMNRIANLQGLPDTKFRDITPDKEDVKEYEFKYQDLRVYAIKIFNGKLVILGGYKNDQDADYVKFRSLKKMYLQFLKSKNEKTRPSKK